MLDCDYRIFTFSGGSSALTTLEDLGSRLSSVNRELDYIQNEILKLKAKPAPCPLEEGRAIRIYFTPNMFKEFVRLKGDDYLGGNISVAGKTLTFTSERDNRDDAIDLARKLLQAAGMRSD